MEPVDTAAVAAAEEVEAAFTGSGFAVTAGSSAFALAPEVPAADTAADAAGLTVGTVTAGFKFEPAATAAALALPTGVLPPLPLLLAPLLPLSFLKVAEAGRTSGSIVIRAPVAATPSNGLADMPAVAAATSFCTLVLSMGLSLSMVISSCDVRNGTRVEENVAGEWFHIPVPVSAPVA